MTVEGQEIFCWFSDTSPLYYSPRLSVCSYRFSCLWQVICHCASHESSKTSINCLYRLLGFGSSCTFSGSGCTLKRQTSGEWEANFCFCSYSISLSTASEHRCHYAYLLRHVDNDFILCRLPFLLVPGQVVLWSVSIQFVPDTGTAIRRIRCGYSPYLSCRTNCFCSLVWLCVLLM